VSPVDVLLTFLSIAGVAFVVLVGGFFLGHDFHADHGFDPGGDSTGGIFSSRVLGTFALGLGAAGAIATVGGLSIGAALLAGFVTGCVLAGAVYGFFGLLRGQQSSMLVPTGHLVGCLGVVVTSIGRDAIGEVGISHGDRLTNFLARAHPGSAIGRGQAIRVVRVAGSLLFVEEASPFSSDRLNDSNRWSTKEKS